MKTLRPTVKRDLSLFSVEAWQRGYQYYLKKSVGFRYPIIFYYDGAKVNFYHTLDDFTYFKEQVTKKVIANDQLFKQLNQQFQKDVRLLIEKRDYLTLQDLPKISRLIGKIMSFYMFVVSDKFVEARPEAWESRRLSEGILYTMDELIEKLVKVMLEEKKYDPKLAHFLLSEEIENICVGKKVDVYSIQKRSNRYIINRSKVIVDYDFISFCKKHSWDNPEDQNVSNSQKELKGQVANSGMARGKVVIVHSRNDLEKVKRGTILVSTMTNINYLIAAKKAAAIVTDEGGVTCHAAILSREINKPCVVGTKTATHILKNGDLVEVDALQGTIKIIT